MTFSAGVRLRAPVSYSAAPVARVKQASPARSAAENVPGAASTLAAPAEYLQERHLILVPPRHAVA
jgi:hypothetical protein